MNKIVFIAFCLFCIQSYSQESLEPLGINPTLARKSTSINRSIDKSFIYAIDTIKLPFKDDFSSDRFKKFNAKPTDANVIDTLFHKILNGTSPDVDTAAFMFDTTYNYRYTPTAVQDSFQIDTIPLPSMGTRTICDLNAYPVTCVTVPVWPPYNTDDTVGTPASPDNVYYVMPPDVVQDSAIVYFVAATDTSSLWQDNFAYRNNDYAINPPTIGVVTMDGLNENGYPYDFSTAFTYGKADYLTSKPIFMDTSSTGSASALSDSIYFSFYYQAEGLGNEPEREDSLVVQFWSPSDNSWYSMWSTEGEPLDSNFKQVLIRIGDAKYLKAGFKFRFVNYSSLSGSFDHWNLDYVFLNSFRSYDDTVRDDVAFQLPTHTLLKDYTAMPWRHFKWDPVNSMLDTAWVYQRNNNINGRLVGGNKLDVLSNGTVQQTITNSNTPSINGFTNFTTSYPIPTTYFYDTMVNDTNATFDIEVTHNTTPDFCRINDTLRFKQVFSDYYAYDDGTAEAAYGVQGLGGINPKIASQFSLLKGDSIKSVFIHFTPSAYNMSSTNIILTIWSDAGGSPSSTKLFEQTTFNVPRYNLGVNGFYEYFLDSVHYLPPGVYYIGWQQTTTDRINVGFDKNIDNANHTFYNSNGTWRKTGFKGTLMIRPSFIYERDHSVGLEEDVQTAKLSLYPNPANSILHLNTELELTSYSMVVMDIAGKVIYSGIAQKQIDVSSYLEGVYLIKLVHQTNGNFKVAKFVKSNQ